MKKLSVFCFLIFLLIFISTSNLVFALISKEVTLEEGKSAEVAGKIILLESAYYDIVIVQVDGYKKIIETYAAEDEEGYVVYKSNTIYINGVNVTVVDIIGDDKAILDISVAFDCGDGVCEESENSKICCEDCNCSAGYSCIDNQCIETGLNECFSDADCDDSNTCTSETCSGLPRKCSYVEIDYCEDYDDCCPEICMYENDADCPRNKTSYECFSWHDCKKQGQSPCNSSACEEGRCVYELLEGCAFNNTCIAINSTTSINETNFTCTLAGWISPEGKKFQEKAGGEIEFKKYLWLFIILIVLIALIVAVSIYCKFFLKKKAL